MKDPRRKQMRGPKMVLMGFDGASWNVIRSLLAQDRLPNLHRLMRRGTYARLITPLPDFTPIIWTTILSGMKASKHGITSFFNTSDDLLVPRLWDIVMHHGKSAGTFGHYFTYPINPGLAFCVPAHFDPGVGTRPESYRFLRELTRTFEARAFPPAKLLRLLGAALTHGVGVHTLGPALRAGGSLLADRSYLNWYHRFQRLFMAMAFDVFLHVYKRYRPDLTAFYTPLPDTVCHKYWCFHEPEHFDNVSEADVKRYGNVIPNTYDHVDACLGRVLRVLPPDTQICLVSDHGFRPMENPHDRLVVVPKRLMDALGLRDEIVVTNLGHQVLVQPKRASEGLLADVLRILGEARIGGKDVPLFSDLDREEDSGIIRFWLNLDQLGGARTKIVLNNKHLEMRDIAKVGSVWTGRHHTKEGLFLVAGPGVAAKGAREPVAAADITPTLLRLQDCPVSEEMDGKVMDDVLDPEWAAGHPPRSVPRYDGIVFTFGKSDEDSEEEIRKQLESLGYM
jgi:hypothetical protein